MLQKMMQNIDLVGEIYIQMMKRINKNELIHLAKQFYIHFIYALSPGLDINYSSEKDLISLKRKFDQVFHLTK